MCDRTHQDPGTLVPRGVRASSRIWFYTYFCYMYCFYFPNRPLLVDRENPFPYPSSGSENRKSQSVKKKKKLTPSGPVPRVPPRPLCALPSFLETVPRRDDQVYTKGGVGLGRQVPDLERPST